MVQQKVISVKTSRKHSANVSQPCPNHEIGSYSHESNKMPISISLLISNADFNITINQQHFTMSIICRYLPNSPLKPTPEDVQRYASPLPMTFKFLKSDNSKDTQEVALLEEEFGFRFLEVIGSLNWLLHTCFEELFAIRKGCKIHASSRTETLQGNSSST